jgi:predicted membrane channel-forming protein YqfA (hemolysin III family)
VFLGLIWGVFGVLLFLCLGWVVLMLKRSLLEKTGVIRNPLNVLLTYIMILEFIMS